MHQGQTLSHTRSNPFAQANKFLSHARTNPQMRPNKVKSYLRKVKLLQTSHMALPQCKRMLQQGLKTPIQRTTGQTLQGQIPGAPPHSQGIVRPWLLFSQEMSVTHTLQLQQRGETSPHAQADKVFTVSQTNKPG